MSVLILLIAVSLSLSAGFVWICIASIRSGQFDDLESPKWRIFFPDSADALPLHSGLPSENPPRIAPHDSH